MSAEPRQTHAPNDTAQPAELAVSDARNRIAELVDSAEDGEIAYLTRRGTRVAAIVPADVAEEHERLEDQYWSRRAEQARERIASGEDTVISLDQLIADAEGGA
ncbi:type II toxin-antitoxin system prevent-host-death family antitoxin [Qaidamihabitans albus]|uniref:type II toxin-antitoxin system prevent-host-death family antitoxin n=1 Tax=Qaidamihabitans albus TaxID=2795733 RepID=UPI0018F117A7|nr:type II toxin-antitoxin system prevent-host-death family antitoxin [Qaidamihabitans albus]